MRKALLAALAVLALVPAGAQAFVLQEVDGLNSPANGIALGPDGNIWAAEEAAESVVRVSPLGTIVGRIPVGGEPFAVAAGPGGRVWVTLPDTRELVWFDATSPSPTAHTISTGAGCEPLAVVAGGNGFVYYSKPTNASMCTSEIGRVKDDGTGAAESFATFGATPVGQAFDLAVYQGKLFVPDFGGDAIQRVGLPGLALEAAINLPAGSGPTGITGDAPGNIWVTLLSGNLAAAPASSANGANAAVLTPTGGTLVEPVGIVEGPDGSMYVPSANSQLLAATGLPSFAFTPLPAGSEPLEIATGPGGRDLWITDGGATRLFRLFNPPAPGGPPASAAPPAAETPKPAPKPAPKLSLSGKSKQPLDNALELKVSCSVSPCSAGATGTLKLNPGGKGATTQPKLTAAKSVQIPAGKSVVLKLKVPDKVEEDAAEVLAGKGGKVTAKITVKGEAGGGNVPNAVFKVTLKKK